MKLKEKKVLWTDSK